MFYFSIIYSILFHVYVLLTSMDCLKNLTEFNTAHNKRISTLTIEEGNLDIQRPKRRRKSSRVSFNEDEEIINPGKQAFSFSLEIYLSA